MKYTSDVPDEFKTIIQVVFNEPSNSTTIQVFYFFQKGVDNYGYLNLPENSYMLVNGNEMNHYPDYSYYLTLDGNQAWGLEFKNFDGVTYYNTIVPPDTVYLANLPDTIPYGQELIFEVNASDNDSNVHCQVDLYEVESEFNYGYVDGGTDSVFTIDDYYLNKENHYKVFFSRTNTIMNPNLPAGGGSIEFVYRIEKTFYVE